MSLMPEEKIIYEASLLKLEPKMYKITMTIVICHQGHANETEKRHL